MQLHLSAVLTCVLSVSALFAQDPQPIDAPVSRLQVRTPHIPAFASGTAVDVRAFLFRNIGPGYSRGHPRFTHALAITNIPGVTCATAILRGDPKQGAIVDLVVAGPEHFLIVLHADFPGEPEFAYMGHDRFSMDTLGGFQEGGALIPKDHAQAQAILEFSKLSRERQFAVMQATVPLLWPFRPRQLTMRTRTAARGDRDNVTAWIKSVRAPNFVRVTGRADKMEIEGELQVATCR